MKSSITNISDHCGIYIYFTTMSHPKMSHLKIRRYRRWLMYDVHSRHALGSALEPIGGRTIVSSVTKDPTWPWRWAWGCLGWFCWRLGGRWAVVSGFTSMQTSSTQTCPSLACELHGLCTQKDITCHGIKALMWAELYAQYMEATKLPTFWYWNQGQVQAWTFEYIHQPSLPLNSKWGSKHALHSKKFIHPNEHSSCSTMLDFNLSAT